MKKLMTIALFDDGIAFYWMKKRVLWCSTASIADQGRCSVRTGLGSAEEGESGLHPLRGAVESSWIP